MSSLTLVRHGQASFSAADYDNLSEIGQVQARLLGDYWVRRRIIFNEVYCGPRLRQKQTADCVGAAFLRAGIPWPDPLVLNELDEYDLTGILQTLAPDLARQDANFAELAQRFRQSDDGIGRARSFQKMFEVLLTHWLTLEQALENLESWSIFRERVQRGLRLVMDAPGRSRRVAMFTSGGFIGTAVHLAMGAPDRAALELNWRIRNCSLTELIFTHDRLTLDSFNSIAHLEDEAHWTYR